MSLQGNYFYLAPENAQAIFHHVYNRNDDVTNVYESMFAYIFSGGIAIRTSSNGKGNELRSLSDEEEENFLQFMKESIRWIDMFGMVPLRLSKKTKAQRIIIPDFASGHFIARIDEDYRLEVGWRTHSHGMTGMSGNSLFPDDDTFVYIHEAPVNQPMPFKSIFAALLDRLDLSRQMRSNYSRGNFEATSPPVALAMVPTRVSNIDMGSEADHFTNVAQAAQRGRTLRAQEESRYSTERAADDAAMLAEAAARGQWVAPCEVCGPDGTRCVIDRSVGYHERRMMLPAGRQPHTVQVPAYNSNWVVEESFGTERIYAIMRWPNPNASRAARQKNQTSGVKYAEADRELESSTVKQKREILRRLFRFVYRNLLREGETEEMVGQLKESKENMEKAIEVVPKGPAVVRKYVQWMEEHGLALEHPAIRARYQFEREQARIKFDSEIEQMAQIVLEEAMSAGELLDKGTVERHLRIMIMEQQTSMKLEEEIESDKDRTELVFLQDALKDSDAMMQMVQTGLMNPRDAAKNLLIAGGTEEERAERLARGATGMPPEVAEKLKLEKRKLELEKEKLKIDSRDKKEKNQIAKRSAEQKSSASASPSKKKTKRE